MRERGSHWRDFVAIILAFGLATALNIFVIATLYTAIAGRSDVPGGISENGTQVITGAFGGIIGVLGSYLGFRAGVASARPTPVDDSPAPEVPPAPVRASSGRLDGNPGESGAATV